MADAVLDAKGLNCPLPILKAKKALKDVPTGGTLEIIATDPGSVADFQAFCRTTGNELLESSSSDGVYTFLIKNSG
jgi:tRNA 2-thiouridine synthesizing protein A